MFSPQEKAHSALVGQIEQMIAKAAGNTHVDREIVTESLDYLIEQIKDHLKALKKKKGKVPDADYEANLNGDEFDSMVGIVDAVTVDDSIAADDADWDGGDID
jgi:hypothetical protein